MPEFLELVPPGEALELLLMSLGDIPAESEIVDINNALGRVTAKRITSPEALPEFARSTVDGYALRAVDTFGASDSLPAYLKLVGEVPMGRVPDMVIQSGHAALIHTGGMLPQGADAVVMLEYTQVIRQQDIEVFRSVAVNENVLKAGEDVDPGEEILSPGVRIRPAEIGGLQALGVQQVEVVRQPKIGIISSGDEVVPPEKKPQPGQVRDINSYTLRAIIQQSGGIPVNYGIIPDQKEMLRSVTEKALEENDAVVITAGSSVSTRDLTSDIIREMGKPGILVHGINIRPGKPTILAVCNGKAVVGLPGNPVSALVIAYLFLVPLIDRLVGLPSGRIRPSVQARLAVNLSSQSGREDWVPARLIRQPDGYLVEPIFYKSNLIFSLVRANGLIHIPAEIIGFNAGEIVDVRLFT